MIEDGFEFTLGVALALFMLWGLFEDDVRRWIRRVLR